MPNLVGHRKLLRWPSPGIGLLAALLLAVAFLDVLAVWGLVEIRSTARDGARREEELRAEALARAFESRLATLRADVGRLHRTPAARRYLAARRGGKPVEERWSRLEVEGSLLLFLEARPYVVRGEWLDEEGRPWLSATHLAGAPELHPPSETLPPVDASWVATAPLVPGPRVWLDPARLLQEVELGTVGGERRLLRTAEAEGSPPASDELEVRVPVVDGGWEPEARWELSWIEDPGEALRSVDSLARRHRVLAVLNGAVLLLGAVVGSLALVQARREARREAEQMARRRTEELERQLFHAQRLATLGQVAAGLAHEVNNPLEGVGNYLALLREDLADGELDAARAHLSRAEEGIGLAAGVIRQVLSRAEEGARPPGRVELDRLAAGTVEFLRSREDLEPPEMVVRPSQAPIPVAGDEVELGQLLLNLLLNAVEARPARGPIEVSLEAEAGQARIVVADRGPGLPPGDPARLMGPFVSRRGSSGLGLSVASRIVSDHGGTIAAENRPGGGAVFTVVLPGGEEAGG